MNEKKVLKFKFTALDRQIHHDVSTFALCSHLIVLESTGFAAANEKKTCSDHFTPHRRFLSSELTDWNVINISVETVASAEAAKAANAFNKGSLR